MRTLAILESELAQRPFLLESGYSIADVAVFAYAHRGADVGIAMQPYGHLRAWIERVKTQPRFLVAIHPYSDDPHSRDELP